MVPHGDFLTDLNILTAILIAHRHLSGLDYQDGTGRMAYDLCGHASHQESL